MLDLLRRQGFVIQVSTSISLNLLPADKTSLESRDRSSYHTQCPSARSFISSLKNELSSFYSMSGYYFRIYIYLVVMLARIPVTLSVCLSVSLSLAIRLCHPSLPAGLLDHIVCSYRGVVWRNKLKNVTYKMVLTSLAVSHMPCPFYLDVLRDGR